jgi:hypothetical protein
MSCLFQKWYFPGLDLVICDVVKNAVLWNAMQLNFVDVITAALKRWYPSTRRHNQEDRSLLLTAARTHSVDVTVATK